MSLALHMAGDCGPGCGPCAEECPDCGEWLHECECDELDDDTDMEDET